MADLFKIKAGDTLKIPVEVTYADNAAGAPVRIVGDFMSTLVDGRQEFWLPRSTVEAAEHIPAPKPPLELGEWVYWGTRTRRYLVVCDQDSEYVRLASKGIADNRVERIELRRIDEAPE